MSTTPTGTGYEAYDELDRYEALGGTEERWPYGLRVNRDREWDDGRRRAPGDGYKKNVGDVERWASVIAGAGLIAYGARQRHATGLAAGTLGAYLIARGIAGRCPLYRVLRLSTCTTDTKEALGGPRGVHVHKVMVIDKPVDVVYRFWRDLSNLPRCGMRHLESVTPLGSGRSHWVAKGPAGMRVEWDAEIINEEENRVIGWRSLENADVVSAGSVNFRETPNGGTEITVRLQYEPPAGRVGAFIAKLFGEEPSQQIEEDLRRVKECLETGQVPGVTEARPAVEATPQPQPRYL